MGGTAPYKNILARQTSIRLSFKWRGRWFKPTLDIPPTPANLKYAARTLAEIERKIEIGTFNFSEYFPNSKIGARLGLGAVASPTFASMVEDWLALIKPDIEATTYREYENTLNRHFVPKLGATRMADFTDELVEKHLSKLGLTNNKTYNNVVSPFRMVLDKAWRWKKMPVNIAPMIESKAKAKPKPDPLSFEQVEAFLVKVARYGEQVRNYFEFAFFAGLRPSELIALLWEDIDFGTRTALVRRALVRTINKATKTEDEREVWMQERAFAVLMRQKELTYLPAVQYSTIRLLVLRTRTRNLRWSGFGVLH